MEAVSPRRCRRQAGQGAHTEHDGGGLFRGRERRGLRARQNQNCHLNAPSMVTKPIYFSLIETSTMSSNAKFREMGPLSLKIDMKTLWTNLYLVKIASESFWKFGLCNLAENLPVKTRV